MIVAGFVVVNTSGRVKRMFYGTLGAAKRGCKMPGDAVVAVEVDLGREPVFIKGRPL